MNIHYYFKYGKGNKIFEEKFYKKGDNHKIPLSIYFGMWRCKDYPAHETDDPQIKLFFSINDSNDIHYFWIFFKEKIYLYRANENKIIDGPSELIDDNGSLPKSIKCNLVEVYKKIELPQVFSNINAYRKYNRKTIVKLEGAEEEIANSLMTKKPININWNNFLDYLSPIEFETLGFLIFNTGKSHCSSFRGGTLKDYDLRVRNNGQYGDLADAFWLQVKKKETNAKRFEDGMYLFHLGKTSIERRIIGREWTFKIIKNDSEIKKWLDGLFKEYDNIFTLNWNVA